MSNSGWNRSSTTRPPAKKKPSAARGIAAGLVVVVLALAGAWYFLGGDTTPTATKDKKSNRIKEVKPVKVEREASREKSVEVAKVESAKTETMDKAQTAAAAATNASEVTEASKKPKDNRLFKNPMDQLLLMVMPKQPGGTVPPLPDISSITFTPEEEDRLLERLAESEDDTDETLDRKELVQSLRDEYHELKKERKWSFVDYVKALEAKVNLDAEVLGESLKLHDTVFNDKSITDAEYAATLEKINKVLADRGIPPIGQQDEESDAPEAGDANVNPEQKETK